MPRTVVPVLTFLLSEISLAAQFAGPHRVELPDEYEIVPAVREQDRAAPAPRPVERRGAPATPVEQGVPEAQSWSVLIVWPDRAVPTHYAF